MNALLWAAVVAAATYLGVRFLVGFTGIDAEAAGRRARQRTTGTVYREVSI